jgi:hypothetical protein
MCFLEGTNNICKQYLAWLCLMKGWLQIYPDVCMFSCSFALSIHYLHYCPIHAPCLDSVSLLRQTSWSPFVSLLQQWHFLFVFKRCPVRISAGIPNVLRFFMVLLRPSRLYQVSTIHQAVIASFNILSSSLFTTIQSFECIPSELLMAPLNTLQISKNI